MAHSKKVFEQNCLYSKVGIDEVMGIDGRFAGIEWSFISFSFFGREELKALRSVYVVLNNSKREYAKLYYNNLWEKLQNKYGDPSSYEREENKAEAYWFFDDISIQLMVFYSPMDGSPNWDVSLMYVDNHIDELSSKSTVEEL